MLRTRTQGSKTNPLSYGGTTSEHLTKRHKTCLDLICKKHNSQWETFSLMQWLLWFIASATKMLLSECSESFYHFLKLPILCQSNDDDDLQTYKVVFNEGKGAFLNVKRPKKKKGWTMIGAKCANNSSQ